MNCFLPSAETGSIAESDAPARICPPCGLVALDTCSRYVSREVSANVRQLCDRVDRRHLEPAARLPQGEPGMQTLLRRGVRRTLSRRPGPSVRAGLRPAVRAGSHRSPPSVAQTEADLRELDVGPVS